MKNKRGTKTSAESTMLLPLSDCVKTTTSFSKMNHAVQPHFGDNGTGFCPRTMYCYTFLFNPDVETGMAFPGS